MTDRPVPLAVARTLALTAALVMAAPLPAAEPDFAPTPAPEASVQLPESLARVLRDYEAAWRASDGAALSRLFTEDGYVLPNGHSPVRGRAAIARYYEGHGGPLYLRAFQFATHGWVGYIVGAFRNGEKEPDMGKFTLTLRLEGHHRWLIASDMDNGNTPARP